MPDVGRIVLASDHGGFGLKEAIKRALLGRGLDVLDVGTHSDASCDYPVFARAAADAIASGAAWRGVVVDGAGIGSCMVANKVPGVRAGMAFDARTAKNAREHNDANLLTLGAGYLEEARALEIVDIFLATGCTVPRHKRRVAMIDALDQHRPSLSGSERALSTDRTVSGTGSTSNVGNEYQRLVESISNVLRSNPGLLSGMGGGSAVAAASPAASTPPGYGSPGPSALAPRSSCSDCVACGHCVAKRPQAVRDTIQSAPDARVSTRPGVGAVPRDVAKMIDHTLLKADATYADVDELCDEAARFGFASVCVNPTHVKRAADKLRNASPVVCTVIGFPLGATPKEVKALEARRAIRDGAREIDMVINIGALKSGDHKTVYEDIRLLAEVARDSGVILKVILETALLTDEEKIAACLHAKKARAHFVKTSTGFSKSGATAHDVALMARSVDYKLEVKASGGVRSAADAGAMIAAGASRIGASVGVKITQEAQGMTPTEGASAGGGY